MASRENAQGRLQPAPLRVPTTTASMLCVCVHVLVCYGAAFSHQPSGTSLMAPQGAQTDSQTSLVASLRFKSIVMGSIGTVSASHAMMYGHPRTPVSNCRRQILPVLVSNKARVTTDGGYASGSSSPSKALWVRSFFRSYVRSLIRSLLTGGSTTLQQKTPRRNVPTLVGPVRQALCRIPPWPVANSSLSPLPERLGLI